MSEVKETKQITWINFKIDKETHTILSAIFSAQKLKINKGLIALINKYIEENKGELGKIVSAFQAFQDRKSEEEKEEGGDVGGY